MLWNFWLAFFTHKFGFRAKDLVEGYVATYNWGLRGFHFSFLNLLTVVFVNEIHLIRIYGAMSLTHQCSINALRLWLTGIQSWEDWREIKWIAHFLNLTFGSNCCLNSLRFTSIPFFETKFLHSFEPIDSQKLPSFQLLKLLKLLRD